MSDDKRNEGQLLSDIVGLESLVDEITYKAATGVTNETTSTAVLGPFWRANAPVRKMGESIVQGIPNGDYTYMHGMVTDHMTGEPIEGAELDVWHTAPNGLYEQQDENQVDFNLRGRFTTGKDVSLQLLLPKTNLISHSLRRPSGKAPSASRPTSNAPSTHTLHYQCAESQADCHTGLRSKRQAYHR